MAFFVCIIIIQFFALLSIITREFIKKMEKKLFAYSVNLNSARKLPSQSSDVGALLRKGFSQHQQGKLSQAILTYEQVLQLQPNNFDALQLLGVIAGQNDNHSLAVDFLTKAVEINPSSPVSFLNLGLSLKAMNRVEEAIASYDLAIKLMPELADAHNNRGVALESLNRSHEALQCFDRAILIDPDYARAYYNRGVSLESLGRLYDAIENYDFAIKLNLEDIDSYFNKSLVLLTLGDFCLGWSLYESRWSKEDFAEKKRNYNKPLWIGQHSILNKTILLHAEQGLGDTIQFCRYVPMFAELGAEVVLEVPCHLTSLLSSLDGSYRIVATGDELPFFDYHCPLMSLPLAFKTSLENIPNFTPYLFVNKAKREVWNSRLGEKKMPRVGLVWSGSSKHKNDQNRSLQLSELIKYLPGEFEYLSLQNEVREIDIEILNSSSIRHFGDDLSDFSDTAALCELVDLVVSVDTSVAHLAGALGQHTWIILPYRSDFRWLLGRNDSPWYQSVKLYRQDVDRGWDSVLNVVNKDLLTFFG